MPPGRACDLDGAAQVRVSVSIHLSITRWTEAQAHRISLFLPQGELLSPCRCDGSVKCTHQPCLIKWISERGCWSCELCYYKYHVIAISTKNPLQVNPGLPSLGFPHYLLYGGGLLNLRFGAAW